MFLWFLFYHLKTTFRGVKIYKYLTPLTNYFSEKNKHYILLGKKKYLIIRYFWLKIYLKKGTNQIWPVTDNSCIFTMATVDIRCIATIADVHFISVASYIIKQYWSAPLSKIGSCTCYPCETEMGKTLSIRTLQIILPSFPAQNVKIPWHMQWTLFAVKRKILLL